MTSITLRNFRNVSFKGFLHSVALIDCNVTHIYSDTFTQLHNVQGINITKNRIIHLDKESFSGLRQLVMIDLSYNLLTSLPQGIFANVSHLAYIYLERNKLESIQPMLFMNLQSMTHIDLSDNYLVSVSDWAINVSYYRYDAVESIDLSRNYLTDIPLWVIRLPSLPDINLSGNRLSFASIRAELKKSYDALNRYGIETFSSTRKPGSINFRHNAFTGFDISTLADKLFAGLEYLFLWYRLDFGENVFDCNCTMYPLYQYFFPIDIDEIRANTDLYSDEVLGALDYNKNGFSCHDPTELRGLPLMQAPINAFGCDEQLPACPKHCRCWVRTVDQAVKVDCGNQSLTQLPDSIPEGSIELDFSNNELTELPEELPNYISFLQVFDLSGNSLYKVNEDIFKARYNMTDLRLHNNELTTLPQTVSD